MTLPILVDRYDQAHPADLLTCDRCHRSTKADSDTLASGLIDEGLVRHDGCGGTLHWRYQEADRCGGCNQLGFFDAALNHCCSRVCMLQAEYAQTLSAREAA